MATIGVKAIQRVDGTTLDGCFLPVTYPSAGGTIGRGNAMANIPMNTVVLVNETDLVPYPTGSGWILKIPSNTLVVVAVAGQGGAVTLQIAETAQPIQVSGPAIPFDGSES